MTSEQALQQAKAFLHRARRKVGDVLASPAVASGVHHASFAVDRPNLTGWRAASTARWSQTACPFIDVRMAPGNFATLHPPPMTSNTSALCGRISSGGCLIAIVVLLAILE
jgi:hypothetical protein